MYQDTIAIVGIGCRFPGGANDPVSFWRNLTEGKDAITPVPEDRWDIAQFYGGKKIHPARSRSKWGGFVGNLKAFDAGFFGISSTEAQCLDPQQRMLLETTWHALEDAGVRLAGRNSVGVYVGAGNYEFAMGQYGLVEPVKNSPYSATGYVLSLLANRISHFLDLTGPSMTVDTACSASLHAVHLACQALWRRECAMALAGGVNCLIYPMGYISFSNFGGLAADGRCKAFDAAADGFVRAEGAGMVLLKPLEQALADRDRIYACIHATGVNQDGQTPVMAAPSPESQEELISRTLADAGVAPEDVQYVEAHGTGTAIGDPVEARAIGRIIGRFKSGAAPCYLGSVKTNIGHLETASGVAGLIKNALICHHGVIPQNLHFNTPNPEIAFDRCHLAVPTRPVPLPRHRDGGRCFLGVNSFGFGGANAFALMSPQPARGGKEADAQNPVGQAKGRHAWDGGHTGDGGNRGGGNRDDRNRNGTHARYILPVSARSGQAFAKGLEHLDTMLSEAEDNDRLRQICGFSALRRAHHPRFRALLTGRSAAELRQQLGKRLAASPKAVKQVSDKVVFVFSGQGPQWYAMGRELYKREKVFRNTLEAAHEALRAMGGWHLLDAFLAEEADSRIGETAYAQPLITALQMGLDRLWRSWGVLPAAVVGHSIGEVAAGVSAGCFDLEEGMRIIYHRGRTMERASSKGAMLAAGISRQTALELMAPWGDSISLAAVNGPSSVTFAGDRAHLARIRTQLEEMERFNRFLKVDYAFHSSFMDPVAPDLLESLGEVSCRPPRVPLWSTVTGNRVTTAVHTAAYWWQNVRQTVLFGPAVQKILETCTLFLEISAHPVLAASVNQCLKSARVSGGCLPSLNREAPDRDTMAESLEALYQAGYNPAWEQICSPVPHMDFWPYPWEKTEYWHENRLAEQNRLAKTTDTFLGRRFDFFDTPTWANQLDVRVFPFLADHRVKDHIFFPAAGFLNIFCAAARACMEGPFELEAFAIHASLVLPPRDVKNIRCCFDPLTRQITLKVSGDGHPRTWDNCATAKVYRSRGVAPLSLDIKGFRQTGRRHGDIAGFYRLAREAGLNYGPHFQTLSQYWTRGNDILGRIRLPRSDAGVFDNTYIAPTILDGVFQLLAVAAGRPGFRSRLYLPVGLDRLWLERTRGQDLFALVRIREHTEAQIRADIDLLDQTGTRTGRILNFLCRSAPGDRKRRIDWKDEVIHETWLARPLDWSEAPAAIPDPGRDALREIHRVTRREYAANLENKVLVKPSFSESGNRLMARFFIDALCRCIKGYAPEMPVDLDALAAGSGAAEKMKRYGEMVLAHLAEMGYARKDGSGRFCITRAAEHLEPLEKLIDNCVRENPANIYELNMIYERGVNLAPMFNGAYDPLEMVAGRDRADYMRYFYSHSAAFHGNNEVVAAVLEQMMAVVPDDRPFRVLEIGAGMGGMTSYMVTLFRQKTCQFFFTDIGPGLVKQGEKLFSEYDFIRYQVLDIEQDPESQGFEPGTFDLVTALDVIHAVQDVDQALAHVAKLLKPGGKFLLSEFVQSQLANDFLFGPIDGWWRFRDQYRKSSPLMDRTQWETALAANGFETLASVSDSGGRFHMNFIAVKLPVPGEDPLPVPADDAPRPWLVAGGPDLGPLPGLVQTGLHGLADVDVYGPDRVVYAGALELEGPACDESDDAPDGAPGDISGDRAVVDLLFTRLISLVSKLPPGEDGLRLAILTRGALCLPGDTGPVSVYQAGMEGLVQVVYNEMPHLGIKLIDLDPEIPITGQVREVMREILSREDREDVVAFRAGRRMVKRCEFLSGSGREVITGHTGEEHRNIRLTVDTPGTLDGLRLEVCDRDDPGPFEVEVEVAAAGVNFRDLLKVLGVYPTEASDAGILGDECAGVVSRVGEKVTAVARGDRVAAVGPGCFNTRVILSEDRVIPLPDTMDTDLAAASLTNYMTVYYALVIKAGMKAGERVLIHSAAGGVGLAAVQIAKQRGAVVFTTTGTPFKRTLLRALGADHVYDSRSLDFAGEILGDTDGQGIDIVLNSLSGPYIEKSLGLLRDYGRFLELGKRDIYDRTHISLYPFRKNISYFAIDMAEMFLPESRMGTEVIRELRRLLAENGVSRHCYSIFPMAGFRDAFSHMSKALHFGKIVLKPAWGKLSVPLPAQAAPVGVDAGKTYLIVGGVRGLGLLIAQWLAGKGATTLVLAGRSGRVPPGNRAVVERLRETARVEIRKTDAGNRRAVEALIRWVRDTCPPLDGIFHCAVVLRDRAFLDMTLEDVRQVLVPKAMGGVYLHEATAATPLRFFMLMGSMASITGNVGQSNYAAANSILKAVANQRKTRGLAAQYVDWGLLAETGIVARDRELFEKVRQFGWQGLNNADVEAYLDRILGYSPVGWGVAGQGLEPFLQRGTLRAPRWSRITARLASARDDTRKTLGADITAMAGPDRLPGMIGLVKQTVARLLDLDPGDIEDSDKLTELGIDSLNGIELLTQFENELGISVSRTSLALAPDINLFSRRLLTLMNLAFDDPPQAGNGQTGLPEKKRQQAPDPALSRILDQVDSLPDVPKTTGRTIGREMGREMDRPVIFLTGATGFLGSHLFRDLLTETRANLYLLIRPDGSKGGVRQRLRQALDRFGLIPDLDGFQDRFQLFEGDLSLPDLGLSPVHRRMIQTTATAVIHAAARVHHLKPYPLLKDANVGGTLEILKLCTDGPEAIPLHFVSTIGILMTELNPLEVATEDALPVRLGEVNNGYLQSKWIAESAVRKLMDRGLPCNIYRPGQIFSKENMTPLTGDFVWRVFKTSLMLGRYPDSRMNLLLAPVDLVCRVIRACVASRDLGRTFHLGDTRPRFKELYEAARTLGYDLEPVPVRRWHDFSLALFEKAPKDHPLADYINAYDVEAVKLMTVMTEHGLKISCEKTRTLLNRMDLPAFDVPDPVLEACITALANAGAIPGPGERH